jgi:hypothetical protein
MIAQRWSGKTRNWQPAGPVWLNPERKSRVDEIKNAASNRRTTPLTNTDIAISKNYQQLTH